MPNSIDVSKPLAAGLSHGSLIVVGTGIRSISHFTQEAIGHIREADAVFYSVPDGVTAAFIRDLNPAAYNLSLHYGEDKRRQVTYVQMAEVILRAVRQGKRVVAVFYGHPGFYVSPARRALNIARKEGHYTEMLPGISSTDYLFADLRIDPAVNGCQILEASDMLLRRRPVVTSSHLVLLQVGSVGDVTYSSKGFKRNKREVLFEYLIDLYGENHPSYYYLGATFPGLDSQIIRRPLKAYRDPAVRAAIHSACSFYLPPKDVLPIDRDMAEKLGMTPPGGFAPTTGDAAPRSTGDYGSFEMEAVARLDREPVGGRPRATNKALYRILAQLAANPRATEAFRKDPTTYVSLFGGLDAAEKAALTKGTAAALHAVSLQVEYGAAPMPPRTGNLSSPVDGGIIAPVGLVKADATEQVVVTTDASEHSDALEQHIAIDGLEHSVTEIAPVLPSEYLLNADATEHHDGGEHHDATEREDVTEHHDATEHHDGGEHHDATEHHDVTEHHDATEHHDGGEHHDATEHHDVSEHHVADVVTKK